MQVLNSLLPIFIVIVLGIVLRRSNFLTQEMTNGFNSFAYYFGLPLFLFYELGTAAGGTGQANFYVLTLLGASLATLVSSWVAAKFLRLSFPSRGAFVQASYRGNLAFIGLPLILFSLENASAEQQAQLESAVLLALAPVVIFYNATAVGLLAIYNNETAEKFSWTNIIRNIVLNPLLIACVGGVIFQTSGWAIPTFIQRTCSVVGASAFPMALIGIGSQMAVIPITGNWLNPLYTAFFKSILCPLVGWLIGCSLGLRGEELRIILILCAVPTAVSGYVLADQMNGDSDLAATSVVVGTVFSLVPLAIVLAIPF